MSGTAIILSKETANDDTASVVAVYVTGGNRVEEDQLLFDVESSKATQEVRAPVAGILAHELAVGQTVGFGVPIGRILASETSAASSDTGEPVAAVEVVPPRPVADQGDPAGIAVLLERETANDETAVIAAVHVTSGAPVKKDDAIFDVENSKVTQEVLASHDGILIHALEPGQSVAFGMALAHILPADAQPRPSALPREGTPSPPGQLPVASPDLQDNQPAGPVAEVARSSASPAPTVVPRFSKAAAALIAQYGLPSTSFTSHFVTTAEVQARLGGLPSLGPTQEPPPERRPTVLDAGSSRGEPVSARKRAEIEALSRGAGGTMLSVLGVTLGPMEIRRPAQSFLQGRIVDLVIYEAARLMKAYPRLNASYDDGRISLSPAVHAGLAIDGGGRLVVYGIENADRASLRDLSDLISDAVARYVDDRLTGADLTRATFTVTDLSDGELDFVLPLLPRGQSCILGITRSGAHAFRLFAGFDHRVTEGREVASFLGDLRARLLSFATGAEAGGEAAHCAYCERSAAEAVSTARDKGLLRIVDRQGREALCCASCWNGW